MKEIHRETRGYPWIEGFVRDFRYGLLALAREPGFAAVTIAVLALGIGANTAMFSFIDAVLWKPLPFPDPDRIVRVWETPDATIRNSTATLTFLDWKHMDTVFEALSVDEPTTAAVTTGESRSEFRARWFPPIISKCSASRRRWAGRSRRKKTSPARPRS